MYFTGTDNCKGCSKYLLLFLVLPPLQKAVGSTRSLSPDCSILCFYTHRFPLGHQSSWHSFLIGPLHAPSPLHGRGVA